MTKSGKEKGSRLTGRRIGLKTHRGGAGGLNLSFADRVFEVVRQIPAGETRSYRQIAAAAGRPRAWRAVGNILNKNYNPKIPCHRVIRSDGSPSGYHRGSQEKIRLLRQEGYRL